MVKNRFVHSKYLSESPETKIMFGQSFLASQIGIPVFTPNFLASTEAAPKTVRFIRSPPVTPMGLPLSLGLACCSTVAKYELKSMWRMVRITLLPLLPETILNFLNQKPVCKSSRLRKLKNER